MKPGTNYLVKDSNEAARTMLVDAPVMLCRTQFIRPDLPGTAYLKYAMEVGVDAVSNTFSLTSAKAVSYTTKHTREFEAAMSSLLSPGVPLAPNVGSQLFSLLQVEANIGQCNMGQLLLRLVMLLFDAQALAVTSAARGVADPMVHFGSYRTFTPMGASATTPANLAAHRLGQIYDRQHWVNAVMLPADAITLVVNGLVESQAAELIAICLLETESPMFRISGAVFQPVGPDLYNAGSVDTYGVLATSVVIMADTGIGNFNTMFGSDFAVGGSPFSRHDSTQVATLTAANQNIPPPFQSEFLRSLQAQARPLSEVVNIIRVALRMVITQKQQSDQIVYGALAQAVELWPRAVLSYPTETFSSLTRCRTRSAPPAGERVGSVTLTYPLGFSMPLGISGRATDGKRLGVLIEARDPASKPAMVPQVFGSVINAPGRDLIMSVVTLGLMTTTAVGHWCLHNGVTTDVLSCVGERKTIRSSYAPYLELIDSVKALATLPCTLTSGLGVTIARIKHNLFGVPSTTYELQLPRLNLGCSAEYVFVDGQVSLTTYPFCYAVNSLVDEQHLPLPVNPMSLGAFARGRSSLMYWPAQADTVNLSNLIHTDSFNMIRRINLAPSEDELEARAADGKSPFHLFEAQHMATLLIASQLPLPRGAALANPLPLGFMRMSRHDRIDEAMPRITALARTFPGLWPLQPTAAPVANTVELPYIAPPQCWWIQCDMNLSAWTFTYAPNGSPWLNYMLPTLQMLRTGSLPMRWTKLETVDYASPDDAHLRSVAEKRGLEM